MAEGAPAPAGKARMTRLPAAPGRTAAQRAGNRVGLYLSLALLVAAGAWALNVGRKVPDRNYEDALRILARYEDMTHPDGRDYGHPIYGKALDKLALVDPGSISASAAALLEEDVRTRIAAFHVKLAEQRSVHEKQRERRRGRRKNAELARQWDATVSQAKQDEPEECCDE